MRIVGIRLIDPASERLGRMEERWPNHSHSIVAGGFPEMSYTTRLIPRTSLMSRLETRANTSCRGHHGKAYYFCSAGCATKFDQNPER